MNVNGEVAAALCPDIEIGRVPEVGPDLFAFCEALPVKVWVLMPDGQLAFCNSRFVEYTGVSRERAADPEEKLRAHHPEDRERLGRWLADLEYKRELQQIEIRLLRNDGTYRWHVGKVSPVLDENGALRFWLGTALEIHEHKQALEDLRERRKFADRLSSASPDLVYLYDMENERTLYCNDAIEPILGYTAQEAITLGNQFVAKVHHPEDRAAARASILEDASRGEENEIRSREFRCIRKDGRIIWVQVRTLAFERGAGGQPRVIMGVGQDITERKRRETEREEHLRLLEHATDGFGVVDRNGKVRELSESLAITMGILPADAIDQEWTQLFDPTDAPRLAGLYDRMLRVGRVDTDCAVHGPDGGTVHLNLVLVPRWQGSTFAGHYLVARDISERALFQGQLETQLLAISNMRLELEQRQLELELANETLARQAITDGLTGLANHRHFQERLTDLDAVGKPYTLLLLDVDHFKAYNDAFGHPAGDELLRKFGAFLTTHLQPGELAARYGGEEFALVLPRVDVESGARRGEELLRAMATVDWPHRAVTASIGCASSAYAGDLRPRADVIAAADAALYGAKRSGRNRLMVAAGVSLSAA